MTFPLDHRPSPTVLGPQMPAPGTRIETLPPLACLHCAATQATVRRERQIAEALLGEPIQRGCCDLETGDCETGNACPRCLGENLEYGTYDWGTDRQTGYADSDERYYPRT